MQARLEVANNKANVKTVTLRKETLIGRGADCHLRIASSEVSRQHCRIVVAADHVTVRDLGSSNGTSINGEPITPNVDHLLKPGAVLSIGGIKFTVRYTPPRVAVAEAGSTVELRPGVAVVDRPVKRPVSSPRSQPADIPVFAASEAEAARTRESASETEQAPGDQIERSSVADPGSEADEPVSVVIEDEVSRTPESCETEEVSPAFAEFNESAESQSNETEAEATPPESPPPKKGLIRSIFKGWGGRRKSSGNQSPEPSPATSADDDQPVENVSTSQAGLESHVLDEPVIQPSPALSDSHPPAQQAADSPAQAADNLAADDLAFDLLSEPPRQEHHAPPGALGDFLNSLEDRK